VVPRKGVVSHLGDGWPGEINRNMVSTKKKDEEERKEGYKVGRKENVYPPSVNCPDEKKIPMRRKAQKSTLPVPRETLARQASNKGPKKRRVHLKHQSSVRSLKTKFMSIGR